MDNGRRVLIFFIIVFFLLNAPGPQSALSLSDRGLDAQVKEQKRELEALSNTTYNAFDPEHEHWLPLPGFTKDAGFAWGILPLAKEKAREVLGDVVNTTLKYGKPEQTSHQQQSLMVAINRSHSPTLPIYRNVTGTVRGDWVRWTEAERADRPHMNLTALAEAHDYFSTEFLGNMTSHEGSVSFEIYDDNTPNIVTSGTYVRGVKSAMRIEGTDPYGISYRNELQGIHVPETGEMFLTTTSEKFSGLIGLPHFTTSETIFEATKHLLNRSLTYATSHLGEEDQLFFPWYKLPHPTDFPGGSMPACEYVVYLQQLPATINGRLAKYEEILAIEEELANPVGAPISSPPFMVMSAIIISPDCGFAIRSKASPEFAPQESLYLMGPKREQYKHHVERFLMLLSAVYVIQAYFLQRQMKECSTPSTQSRASFYTIAMMSIGDGLSLCFALLVVSKDANTLAVCTTAFAGFASMAFLGLKFQMEIWLAHAPERHRAAQQERQHRQQALNEVRGRRAAVEQLAREQQAQSRASNTASVEQARIDGRLPIPVTSPAIFNPSDQDTTQPIETPATAVTGNDAQPTPARDGATMYYGFYFTLSCLFISTAWALLWPKPLAYGYGYMITFAYLSFWTPQIFRNAMRNCRKALTWEYVVGESLSRVFIPVYLCTVSGNVYYIEPNITVAVGFAAWVWIQAWILVGQDLIGPRFFVPKGWTPPAYNYHPILRDDSAEGSGADIEAGDTLPLGYLRADKREISPTTRPSSSSSEILSTSGEAHKQDGHKHLFDCAICMQVIEVPVVTKENSGAAVNASTLFNRRQYMVTPCRHIFHTTCLESWMGFRLQCPICREAIPAV